MKKVWMSSRTAKNHHYTLHLVIGMIGVAVLAVVLISISAYFIMKITEYKEAVSLLFCLMATALIIFLAVWLGRSLQRDAMIFCEDEEGHLYVMDVRQRIGYQRGLIGAVQMAGKVQKELAKIKHQTEQRKWTFYKMPEIIKVDVIKEHIGYYSLVCQVKYDRDRVGKHTYILGKGYDDENQLIYALQRKKQWENTVEEKPNKQPVYILLCTLLFVALAGICTLSHPYMERLPKFLYFPCLGCAFIVSCLGIYFTIQYRRGE